LASPPSSCFAPDKPTLEASWKVSDKIPVDGLSAKVHFDATDKSQTAGVSIAYEHKFATFNGRVNLPISVQLLDFAKDIANQDTKAELDLVVAHPDYKFVAGASTKVSFEQNGQRKVDESEVSLGYRDGKLFAPSIVYKQVEADQKRTVTAVFITQPADTQYVGQVEYELNAKKTTATVGLSYPLSDGAVVKAKINSSNQAGLSYSKQITAATKLDFGTLFQLSTEKNVAIDAAFAFNLKFTQ